MLHKPEMEALQAASWKWKLFKSEVNDYKPGWMLHKLEVDAAQAGGA